MNIPVELFLGGIVVSIALAIFGFIRQPQIPVMLVVGGMFILTIAVMTDGVIMGKIPITSTSTSSTVVTYEFVDNVYAFDELAKVMFALMGVMCMLCGGLMSRSV